MLRRHALLLLSTIFNKLVHSQGCCLIALRSQVGGYSCKHYTHILSRKLKGKEAEKGDTSAREATFPEALNVSLVGHNVSQGHHELLGNLRKLVCLTRHFPKQK